MYLYYPLLNPDDKIYDCSGTESIIKDASTTNFPTSVTDGLNFNAETTSIPVSSYFVFSGTSKIESDSAITMPSNFTITFWLRKTTINSSQQIIFRAGGFKIYTLSTNLHVEYNGTSYSIPIMTGKWGFFSIRQGEVDVYNYNLTSLIQSDKRILHITSSFIDNSTTPINYISNSSSGGYDQANIFPTIYDQTTLSLMGISNISKPYVFSRNLLNIVEKSSLFNSDIVGNKFFLLEGFSDTLCEFRIWDKLVDDYKTRVIERGSYIFISDGDITQNLTNVKIRIESIREANKIDDGIDYDGNKSIFMHSQSISTLSTHNETLSGVLFPVEVKNESLPPNSLALNQMGISSGQESYIFANDPSSTNQYLPITNYFLANTTLSNSAYVQEKNFNGIPDNLYFAQVAVSVDSSRCSSIEIFSDNSDSNYTVIKESPEQLEDIIIFGIIKMNSNGEFYIKHNYPSDQQGTAKSLIVKSILLINISENGISDFFDNNGYNSVKSKNLALYLLFREAYKNILYSPTFSEYINNVNTDIRLFPILKENIYNLADTRSSGLEINANTQLIDNESLYEQLIEEVYPGMPTWQYLEIPEVFLNNLIIPDSIKAVTKIEKYFLSMPDMASFSAGTSSDVYEVYIKGLEPNKEYSVRVVLKNLSSVPEMTPAYSIIDNNFSHIKSATIISENGTDTGISNPLVQSGYILNEVIPEEYVANLPIDDIEIISAFVFSDENGIIKFKREYPVELIDDPILKVISLYDISVLDVSDFRKLEKTMDLSEFKEKIFPSSAKDAFIYACNLSGVSQTDIDYYLNGIDNWISSMLFSSITPYLIPTKEYEPANYKEMLVEFYPPSKRKKYTIENLQHAGYYSSERVVSSGSTILLNYDLNVRDTADKLMYYSYNIKSNTGGPINITLKAIDQIGNVLGTQTSTTISTAYTPVSILIREGWNKTSNNKIKSIVLETNGSCSVKYSVECDLTSNDVEDWLSAYNLRTLVYKDGFVTKVNTNEKKVLWCDKFLNYEFFIPANGFIVYNMLNPSFILKSSEIALQDHMDSMADKVEAYYQYIALITNGEEDSPIEKEDFFPVAWMHRNGSTQFSSGQRVHGVGISSGEFLELKDIE